MLRRVVLCGLAALGGSIATGQVTDDTCRVHFGGSIGLSMYTARPAGIPVSPLYGQSTESGLSFLWIGGKGHKLKAGLEYTYVRSGFVDDTSHYDGFIQVPLLFPLLRMNDRSQREQLLLSVGVRFSLLAEQGRAARGDEFYIMNKAAFGGLFKTGIITELACYAQPTPRTAQSWGVRLSTDLQGISAKLGADDLILDDRFVMGTLFYSFHFR